MSRSFCTECFQITLRGAPSSSLTSSSQILTSSSTSSYMSSSPSSSIVIQNSPCLLMSARLRFVSHVLISRGLQLSQRDSIKKEMSTLNFCCKWQAKIRSSTLPLAKPMRVMSSTGALWTDSLLSFASSCVKTQSKSLIPHAYKAIWRKFLTSFSLNSCMITSFSNMLSGVSNCLRRLCLTSSPI